MDSSETDPYSVLGVHKDASYDDIRRAYLRLARRVHPDVRDGEPVATERMSRINRAWELLSDAEARAALDLRSQSVLADRRGSETVQSGVGSDSRDDRTDDLPDTRSRGTDDLPITTGRLPEWWKLGAPVSGAAGVLVLILGFVVGIAPMMAFGLFMLVVSGLLFVLAPFAVFASSRNVHSDLRTASGRRSGSP